MNFLRDFTGRGTTDPDLSTIESASPLTYARSTSAPVLLVHGTKDSLVHHEQSVRFHEKLQSLGVPSRLISLPNRGHAFDYIHPRERRQVFEQMLAFLAEQGCGVNESAGDTVTTRIAAGQEAR
jgi:dipeptidyl aminopeptidase/acylaminoacyl peptidase